MKGSGRCADATESGKTGAMGPEPQTPCAAQTGKKTAQAPPPLKTWLVLYDSRVCDSGPHHFPLSDCSASCLGKRRCLTALVRAAKTKPDLHKIWIDQSRFILNRPRDVPENSRSALKDANEEKNVTAALKCTYRNFFPWSGTLLCKYRSQSGRNFLKKKCRI